MLEKKFIKTLGYENMKVETVGDETSGISLLKIWKISTTNKLISLLNKVPQTTASTSFCFC
jgi:hypothetical protein